MAWYAVYRIADGELVSVGERIDPDALPAALAFTPLPDRPDLTVQAWDNGTHAFVARVASKAELEIALTVPYTVWRMWADALAEATKRSMAAAVITALTNKTNAAWTDFAAAVDRWRNA
jgi:hypothetical protein